jgi:hypothetical protein
MSGEVARLIRPIEGKMELRLPFGPNNRRAIKRIIGAQSKLDWDRDRKAWLIARNHFRALCIGIPKTMRLGLSASIFVKVSETEICDTRCIEAVGTECECSCRGEYHGGLNFLMSDGWQLVSETTLVRSDNIWVGREFVYTP